MITTFFINQPFLRGMPGSPLTASEVGILFLEFIIGRVHQARNAFDKSAWGIDPRIRILPKP
jgi:hypothetical protein